MGKFSILKNGRIILLLFVLFSALLAISPQPWNNGATIQSVDKNSNAYEQGITVDPSTRPTNREFIVRIEDFEIKNTDDYYDAIKTLETNSTVRVETNKNVYRLKTDESGDLGFTVTSTSKTNVRKGLDLQGGTRVFLKPVEQVEDFVLDQIVESLKLRLNAFGLSDIIVKKITTPHQFIVVEIAGATQDEVRDLVSSQGNFEAKINNQTVFTGQEIKFVGVGAQDALITNCGGSADAQYCEFQFTLTISADAAKKFAEETDKLTVEGEYLSAPIDLFLDGEMISNLSIVSSLKGRDITNPSVTGGESGRTQQEAYDNAYNEMKRLQTILESGSLPVKLNIAQSFTISPSLGEEFSKNALWIGFLSVLTVTLIIFLRYKKFLIVFPVFITLFSEIFLMLGLAALVSWQLDLASIAGIIVAAGTGVDDQIVIIDEVLRGKKDEQISDWKKKMKKAFFIIFAAYTTTVVAMIPLWWAGAGLLKGFAFTTIAGVTFGVFITRPAFAVFIEKILNR